MASTDEGLTVQDAALVALDAAEGTIEGRTAMQKIMYFVSVALDRDFGHRAHYYGPFSRTVEGALTLSALGEDVIERVELLPEWSSGRDLRKYTYELTPDGEKVAEAAAKEHPEEAATVRETVEAVRSVVPDLDQYTLSMAAKVDYIVYQQTDRERIPLSEIPKLANQLGWRISEPQVEKSVELLTKLGRLAA